MLDQVGNYRVTGSPGGVDSTRVSLARGLDGQSTVRLKRISDDLRQDAGFMDRFRQESEVMKRLTQPNCVPVVELVEDKAVVAVVTGHVPGPSLRQVLDKNGRLTPEQAVAVTRGILGGLAFAHELGLVHRDLKPENVLLDGAGQCRLLDFGQASYTGEAVGGTRQTTGSPGYMSPEQARGESGDVRSDIYSVAAVLYELLAGRPPFVALSRMAVMKMHLERQPPDLTRVNPRVPAALAAAINQALAKEARDRYQSAGEFQAVLEEVARDTFGPGWLEAGSVAGLVELEAVAATEDDLPEAVAPAPAAAEAAEAPEVTDAPAGPTGPAAIPPETLALIPAPEPRDPPPSRQGPATGRGAGIAAAFAGLVMGAALGLLLPASRSAPPAVNAPGLLVASASPAPRVPLRGVAARFDAASGATFYTLQGAQPSSLYSWAWIKKPACGTLQADPGGLGAAYQHQGCDPVVEGRGVIGVCEYTGHTSAIYQRNARFDDGSFSPAEASAAGVAGDQFSQVDGSTADDLCVTAFGRAGQAQVTPVPGAPAPTAPAAETPGAQPAATAAPGAGTQAEDVLPLAGGAIGGALVALLGLAMLRRGTRP